MHVVPSVKGALRCKKAGVDVIVASGHEGGFHTSWEPVHSMILLPAVVEAVSDENTLVCGAGGFCDGKTLAAALVLGADGAQMGTRFLATQESDFHQIWKEGVVAARRQGNPCGSWLCRTGPVAEDPPEHRARQKHPAEISRRLPWYA